MKMGTLRIGKSYEIKTDLQSNGDKDRERDPGIKVELQREEPLLILVVSRAIILDPESTSGFNFYALSLNDAPVFLGFHEYCLQHYITQRLSISHPNTSTSELKFWFCVVKKANLEVPGWFSELHLCLWPRS